MNKKEWHESIQEVGVVVGCLIFADNKYLLVQEKQKDAYGLWNVPAGHVDKGESLQHAAIREVLEETGLNVEINEEIAIYHEEAHRSIKHIYSAVVLSGTMRPQEGEIMDVRWLKYDEIRKHYMDGKLRKPWVWDIINKHHIKQSELS